MSIVTKNGLFIHTDIEQSDCNNYIEINYQFRIFIIVNLVLIRI